MGSPMPELPEVERERRRLAPAMVGARFIRVRLNREDLRVPFPPAFARRLRGQTVQSLRRRGKYLLADLSSGDVLVMHLGMSGSFRIEPTTRRLRNRDDDLDARHDHVVFELSSGQTITFNDPRRFGLMQLAASSDDRSTAFGRLGPEPLSAGFNAGVLAAQAARRRTSLKVLLLDQRVVAGLGNIYVSEALHLARLSPFRDATTLAASGGHPRAAARALVAAIKSVLRRAVRLKEGGADRSLRFRVYDREGEQCLTPGCKGTIARMVQAGRSTFYCPVCQR
jgi:formamidopyrimidine-DNA glycosylase